jgi:hypothetical protein
VRPYGRERLSAGELTLIESLNALDQRLYQRVGERLERDIDAAGPAFRRDLSTFRVLNRVFQSAAAAPLAVRARLSGLRRRAARMLHA